MEPNKIASTGRDNTSHTRRTRPVRGAHADWDGSRDSDGRAQIARERIQQYSAGRSTPRALVDLHITTLLNAHRYCYILRTSQRIRILKHPSRCLKISSPHPLVKTKRIRLRCSLLHLRCSPTLIPRLILSIHTSLIIPIALIILSDTNTARWSEECHTRER
jgi:hypothetical protein